MLLNEWAKQQPPGVYTRLQNDARVSYKTVLKSARDGKAIEAESAEKLSAATGGVCSVDEIRHPEKYRSAAAAALLAKEIARREAKNRSSRRKHSRRAA